MFSSAFVLAGAWLAVLAPNALRAQDLPPQAQPQAPLVRSIAVTGAKEIPVAEIERAIRVKAGEPLTDTPEHITQAIERHYRSEGYCFARVKTDYDAASGGLAIDIDEGRIDEVEFQGIDKRLIGMF